MHKFTCPVSTVGIAIGYRLDGWGSIPSRARDFSALHSATLALWSTQFPLQLETGALSSGVKKPGCQADLPSTEVKNSAAVPPVLFILTTEAAADCWFSSYHQCQFFTAAVIKWTDSVRVNFKDHKM
jgi:hypothetical protein